MLRASANAATPNYGSNSNGNSRHHSRKSFFAFPESIFVRAALLGAHSRSWASWREPSVKSSVTEVKGKVEVQFDKIEKAFDSRVAAGLNRLGIPSKQDVETLSAKLDELNALLERVARTQ